MSAADVKDQLVTSAWKHLRSLESELATYSLATDTDTSSTKTILNTARSRLENLRNFESAVTFYEQEATSLTSSVKTLRATPAKAPDERETAASTLSIDDLTALLANLQSRLGSEDDRLDDLLATQTSLNQRSQKIYAELEQLASTSWDTMDFSSFSGMNDSYTLSNVPSFDTTSEPAGSLLVYRAKILLDTTLKLHQTTSPSLLRREQATLIPRQRQYSVRIENSRRALEIIEQYIVTYSDYLQDTRALSAEQIIRELEEQLSVLVGTSSGLDAIALHTATLSREITTIVDRVCTLTDDARDARRRLRQLKQSQSTASNILAVRTMNKSSGGILRRLRIDLPRSQNVKHAMASIVEELSYLQTDIILWRDVLNELQDTTVSVIERLTRVTDDQDTVAYNNVVPTQPTPTTSADTSGFTSVLLEQQADVLNHLLDIAGVLAGQLDQQSATLNAINIGSHSMSVLLDRQLLWLRNKHNFSWEWLLTIPVGVAWLFSPLNWAPSLVHLVSVVKQQPIVALSLFLLPIGVHRLRPTLRGRLTLTAERVGKVGRDTYATTPRALVLSILLAAPVPALIGALAWLMNQGQASDTYSQALVLTLTRVAVLIFVLNTLREMCRADGLMTRHFRWSEKAIKTLHRHLGWFIAIQCVSSYVFLMGTMSGDVERQYGIGLIAFLISSISMASAAFHIFRPESGIVASITDDTPPSLPGRLLFPFIVLAPLIVGILPIIGFFDTAIILQSRLFESGYLFVVATIVYGLLLRLYSVAHRRFALARARQRRTQLGAERLSVAEGQGSGEAVPISDDEVADSNSRISNQAHNTLVGTSLVLFVTSLWLIWRPLFPALGIADEIILYRGMSFDNGINNDQSVSLWNLVKALSILYLAFWSASNIRGLLEVSLFERLNLDAGARYALISITGYLLIGVGLVAGFSQLGVDWSKLQWVVAALGVGLGFGLQEIVANFISGIVILFERPIRVGDIVTIGTQSGTVRYIRIRATTITDFDNREVILPNKQVVTENVINWTLHDSVTRLLLTVGIAYGSDIEKARELITAVVEAHPDVMDTPEPSVLFMRHGDSSLEFEVRVFVAQTMRRLLLTHELNSAIDRDLLANGFEIPFPQRVVHLRGEGT